MKTIRIRGLPLLLALALLCVLSLPAGAAADGRVSAAAKDTASYISNLVKSPQVGSVGGEWAVLGLARSGYAVPEKYYQDYYARVEKYVTACGGVLHNKKYTEYSRVIVALSAIGKDPANVGGYNLLVPLGDYERTIWQGLNGPIWALIALDSGSYAIPQNPQAKTQATRQMYIDRILACQLSDGGWSLFGGTAAAYPDDGVSDPDITGMALQALAKYQDQPSVVKATQEALACMSARQDGSGGYASWGTANSESCVQMIVALCELGIPLDDSRFIKNGHTMTDNLLTFYRKGNGFLHTAGGSGSNQMATEQGLYGLVAVRRAENGQSSLYRMGDARQIGENAGLKKGGGLEGKIPDIRAMPVVEYGKSFADTAGANAHVNQPAIEALAARGIINGRSNGLFEPDATMTRAEFAAIITRGLGLAENDTGVFSDVSSDAWYAGYIGTANRYGIIYGIGDGRFNPGGTITRQEAAVMVARAAKLCGMETAYSTAAARDVLAQFPDYVKCAEWSRTGLAFCYDQGILDSSALTMEPTAAILRCEIAQMLFNLLTDANLM